MKILIDECVPAPFARLLSQHTCRTVEQCGWRGIQNGALISLAEKEFDLSVTADQNIRYQQNLAGFRIAVVELSTNDFKRLRDSVELIRSQLERANGGNLVRVLIP